MVHKYGIHPKLIRVMTGRDIADVSVRPTVSMLPGRYGAKAAKALNRLSSGGVQNIIRLRCAKCGKAGEYNLGMVAVDLRKVAELPNWEKYIQVSGYFRCKHCNAAGDWMFFGTPKILFRLRILGEFFGSAVQGEQKQKVALPAAFIDGKIVVDTDYYPKWATDAEEYFLEKLAQQPENARWWERLGNVYNQGGRIDLAATAYEHVLQLDAYQMGVAHSLAMILYDIGEWEAAAGFYRQTLCVAHHYDRLPALEQRDVLVNSLRMLFHMYGESDKTIAPLPSPAEERKFCASEVSVPHGDTRIVYCVKMKLNPDKPETLLPLAEMYMGQRREELPPDDRHFR